MGLALEYLKKASPGVILIQLVLILLGVIGSIALVVLGLLQEDVFGVVTAPLVGAAFQLEMLVSVQLSPLLILFFGTIGFMALYLVPGVIITYPLIPKLDGFSRALFGTAISLLVVYFPVAYGLLLGLPPHWLLGAIPFILAVMTLLMKPELISIINGEVASGWVWLRNDISNRRNIWFWLTVAIFLAIRIALFSLTDSYWTDSVTYVGYANAMMDGTLLSGHEIINPIGFPLVSFPFVWITGEVTWGLALANWCLTSVALLGAIPLLRRIHAAWPTERKPPFRVILVTFMTFPWMTILMSSIFHEASLLFFTILGTSAIGGRLKYGEIWLALSVGIGYLIRPTHALMFFVFMLIPLYENRDRAYEFIRIGLRSLLVAAPVVPLLVRNFIIEGWFLADYDLQYFSLENVPWVLWWFASFITHSSVGLFSLLFVLPFLILAIFFLTRLPRVGMELGAWFFLSAVSFVVFALYPSDQPRLFAFFMWLLPVFLVYEAWNRGWEFTAVLLVGWQVAVFGAIPFSPQGWIIDGGSSYLTRMDGLLRPLPELGILWVYAGLAALFVCWVLLFLFTERFAPANRFTSSQRTEDAAA